MRTVLSTIGWGIFCASSWTWCIGMFLPHIMLNRYGWPGFLAFAVPNVIGCGLFGYVVLTAARSRRMVNRHHTAMMWFSAITVAFHVYFASFAVRFLVPEAWLSPWTSMLPLVLLTGGAALSLLSNRLTVIAAVIVYAFSLFVFSRLGVAPLQALESSGVQPSEQLMFLAPIVAVGFMLCPYLDLTFHRALQQSNRHAFAVFGLTFAVMITLTAAYWPTLSTRLPGLVCGHLAAQALLTVGLHLKEIRVAPRTRHHLPALLVIAATLPVIFVVSFFDDQYTAGRDIYIRFLVFYGLLFPTYALMFIGPGPTVPLTPRTIKAMFFGVLVMAPMYELGFVHHKTMLLLLPLGAALGWVFRPSRDAAARVASG